ncbi:MAG: carotenoid 1,2-hydratase [Firmicutes bacterium]|nr:carotenoid 1,2-hydratase [Bacillota bacterium]
MNKIPQKPYDWLSRGGAAEEWIAHRRCQDWWYCTGVVRDDGGKLFTYQFTILRLSVLGIRFYLLMLALTDFSAGKHYYYQTISPSAKEFTLTPGEIAYGGMARAVRNESGMSLTIRHKRFSLDLDLDYGKGAAWHCDNGNLIMGTGGGKYSTQYYSYPNMPTAGTLTLNGQARAVRGKTWFDKQYGPFPLLSRLTHWEWFSLRFDDGEEVMLFSFPQDDYRDGTYIRKDGAYERLQNYTITPHGLVCPDGRTAYSCGWDIQLPGVKEESYTVKPLLEGQMNMGYYELLAGVYNPAGEQVGFSFAELLPGARSKKFPIKLFNKADQE